MPQIVQRIAQKKGRSPRVIMEFAGGAGNLEIHPEALARHKVGTGSELSEDALLALLKTDEEIRAREKAWLLLSIRPRTQQEMFRALRQRKFPESLAEQVAAELVGKGFIDDAAFARLFVDERTRRRQGPKLIEQELRGRGLPREQAREAVAQGRDEERERADARALLEKWNRRSKPADPRKRQQAAAAFLVRRGYGSEVVWALVREVIGARGAEDE